MTKEEALKAGWCGNITCTLCYEINAFPDEYKENIANTAPYNTGSQIYSSPPPPTNADIQSAQPLSDYILFGGEPVMSEDKKVVVKEPEEVVVKNQVLESVVDGKKKRVTKAKLEPLFSSSRLYDLGNVLNSLIVMQRNPKYYLNYPPQLNKWAIADLEKVSDHWKSISHPTTKAKPEDVECEISVEGVKLIKQAQAKIKKASSKGKKKVKVVKSVEVETGGSYAIIT